MEVVGRAFTSIKGILVNQRVHDTFQASVGSSDSAVLGGGPREGGPEPGRCGCSRQMRRSGEVAVMLEGTVFRLKSP